MTCQGAAEHYHADAWQEAGAQFGDWFSDLSAPHRANILDWVMRTQEDTGSLLEVSCHHGNYIETLRRRGYRGEYTGIDITPGFLEVARQRLPAENFQWGDARSLEFPPESFDLVLAVGILMHLPQPMQTLRDLFRIAGKHLILSVYGRSDGPTIWQRSDAPPRHIDWFFSKEDILAQLPAGWQLAEFAEIQRPKPAPYSLFHQYLLRRA